MSVTELEIGRVVIAKAGRDKEKAFIIIGCLDSEYVLIADGESRTIDKPKKKKIKHLDPKPEVMSDIQAKLQTGRQVFDAEIRKSLKSMGYEN